MFKLLKDRLNPGQSHKVMFILFFLAQSPPRVEDQRVDQTQKRVFEGFSNLVERASNDVSESILKQF